MQKNLPHITRIFTIIAILLLTSCTGSLNTTPVTSMTNVLSITSEDELNTLFNKLNYSAENWKNINQKVPRIIFQQVSENWVKKSPKLPVHTKKSIFFRLMTPLILIANENILREREIVKHSALNKHELSNIAFKYGVINNKNVTLTENNRQTLLTRVDILPTSLALAQAAEESGWGTSRFALQGNAFFGQWEFSDNAMKPQQQRKQLGNYGVARFVSPLASVEAYMFNINTHRAYRNLRLLRTEKRNNNILITGYQLATTLDKYSERGQDYVHGLRNMIRYNKLEGTDKLLISNESTIYMINTSRAK